MVFGPFGEFGSVYVFFVLQKIKEKYFSFQGGDLASVGLSNCATKLCVKLYTGPPKYYFFFRKKLCVKCNLTGIITLHSFGVVCYCVHITERNTMSNNKTTNNTTPKLTLVSPRYTVSLSESLYSVVYSESAFKGLTQHPCHFHTIQDAQQFINDQCKPNHPCYIIQVPVVAHT